MGVGHVDTIGDVAFVHAPMEESEEDADAIFLPKDPQTLQLVVLGHISQVILQEVIDVLAEEIEIGLGEDAAVGLGVDDELQEQHKE